MEGGRAYMMGPAGPNIVGGGDIRVPLIKADRCLKRTVSVKKGPKWCCGGSVVRALRLRCCVVPPPRHRLLALVLLATGAYCVLVHPQLLHQTPPLPLAAFVHGNRTRNLAAVRDNLSSASNHRVSDDGSDIRHHALSLFAGAAGQRGEMEEEMARRRARVWQVCRSSGLVSDDGTSKVEPNAWEFFVDEHHHLVWCNIFKAASSSWMYNFNLLGGYKEQYLRRSRKSPLALARERFPRPSVEQLKAALPHSLSFLIVRDPFERLLSAYRNKIEGFRHKFYRKMAREMISKFRFKTSPAPGTHRSLNNEKSPTFSEFASWVIESANNAKGVKDGGYSGIPGFDEHWAPYYRFCTPCAVNFSVVAKMETLARDEAYIIEKSGIGGALGRKAGALDMSNRPREAVNAAIGARTEDVLPRYFQTLNKEQIDSLYDIYKIDFLMFGYDVSKYYNMLPS
ncbi:carbohydrate sulfotransferase 11-like isoform X2 [Ischnura elegans]|uniref:carbohydrate sulfotransferase 11-like isoform X2 n=1 Tax=Ischnura elegans TaxID=197161 RepID=UPI001ED87E3F|nr:carbohydrate sulfotransferase 11-like isoform X2 [Ischnura elegans]